MAIIKRKPRNSSLRFQSFVDFSDITTKKPHPGLVVGAIRKSGGRNSYGRITMRHRGGGADKRYRIIDFKRTEKNVPGKVKKLCVSIFDGNEKPGSEYTTVSISVKAEEYYVGK